MVGMKEINTAVGIAHEQRLLFVPGKCELLLIVLPESDWGWGGGWQMHLLEQFAPCQVPEDLLVCFSKDTTSGTETAIEATALLSLW